MRGRWKDVSFETAAILQLSIANGSSQARFGDTRPLLGENIRMTDTENSHQGL